MATKFTTKYSEMLEEVYKQLHKATQSYKASKDLHHREKLFHVGDLVMVRLRRERFPPGTYSKLSRRKIGPFPIITIDLPASYNTSSTFNVSDFWPYHPPDSALISISSSESISPIAGED